MKFYLYFIIIFILLELGLNIGLNVIYNSSNLYALTISTTHTNKLIDFYLKIEESFKNKICSADKTLVVFDLDDTLITNQNSNQLAFYKQLKENNCNNNIHDLNETDLQFDYFIDGFFQLFKFKKTLKKTDTTQFYASIMLDKLNEKTRVLALTARHPLYQHETEVETNFANINFNHSKQKLSFDDNQFITLTNKNLNPILRSYLQQNGLEIKLKVHKNLFEFNQFGKATKMLFTFNIPMTADYLEILKKNDNTYYIFSATDLGFPPNVLHNPEHFSLFSEHTSPPTLPLTVSALSYHNGILMSGDSNKGIVLRNIIQHSEGLNPVECIFFIDDNPGRTAQMDKAFSQRLDIKVFNFVYNRIKNIKNANNDDDHNIEENKQLLDLFL
ncbi:MAG: DUF2608 domain-containing protein [Oligoflexia bacterium]|nr:DUF2608 domain-containing protein [Oligoflexia bacterium]